MASSPLLWPVRSLVDWPCAAMITPSVASRIGNWSFLARSTARSTWRWVTCETSWATTPATSSSLSAASTVPALTPM